MSCLSHNLRDASLNQKKTFRKKKKERYDGLTRWPQGESRVWTPIMIHISSLFSKKNCTCIPSQSSEKRSFFLNHHFMINFGILNFFHLFHLKHRGQHPCVLCKLFRKCKNQEMEGNVFSFCQRPRWLNRIFIVSGGNIYCWRCCQPIDKTPI